MITGRRRVHLSPGAFVLPIGGVRRTARELLHGLRSAGADVAVTRWITGADAESNRPFGVAGRTLLQVGDAVGHLGRLVLRRRPVTHALYYDLSVAVSGSPVVVTAYDMIHERFDVGGRLLPLAKRTAIKRADAVVCISEATAVDVREHFPKARNVQVIHLGVGHRMLTDSPPASGVRRHLLFVGQRASYKNAALMFEAIERDPDLRTLPLVLVGGGPLTDRERDRLACSSVLVEHRIDVDESELIELYDSAIALVVPSRVEGFGLPVVEAMARRCPVACASVPSLLEVSGGHAAVFAPDDPESCADAIRRAIAASDEAVRAAQRHARGFTWDRTVRQHLDLYDDLVG